jgi:hypothetical protein
MYSMAFRMWDVFKPVGSGTVLLNPSASTLRSRAEWGGLRNKSLNPAASPRGDAFSGKDTGAEPAVSAGVDHTVASAMPAFPDLQMNCRRVKEVGFIERDLDL